MTNAEFRNKFDNGFEARYIKGSTDIKCPKCGLESYLTKSNSTTITCNNKHNFTTIDFTVEWIKLRDGFLNEILTKSCDLNCSEN